MSNKNQMQPLSDAPSTLPKPLANFATTLLTRKTASVAQMNTQFKAYSYLPSPLDPLSQVVFSSKTKLLAHNISDLKNPEPIASSFKAMADNSIEEKLFNASSQIKILTSQISMHLDTKYRERLFSQIDALHALDEWDPDDKPIQVTSFKTFLKTIVHLQPERYPSLGLSYSGNLLGAWMNGKDRLTIEFLPNDIVKWSFSKSINEAIVRSATQAPLNLLLEGLSPYKPNDWFFN